MIPGEEFPQEKGMICATVQGISELPSGVWASFLSLKLRTDYSVPQQVREELREDG